MSGPPATGSRGPSWTTARRPSPSWPERLGLTQAAVRRHLDALVADDVVEAREQRVYGARDRGRPAKVFALTDCGRDAFDQSYDELAADALRWIRERTAGTRRSSPSPARRIAAQAERYRAAVEAADPERAHRGPGQGPERGRLRCHGAAAPRSASSSASTTARSRTSPSEFPQLCEAETEVFSQLLGTPRPAAGHHRARRRRLHDVHPRQIPGTTVHSQTDHPHRSTAGRNPA